MPSPPQTEQVDCTCMLPRKVCCILVSRPEPPQCEQVSILVPGSAPLPLQWSHLTRLFRAISRSTPETDSLNSIVISVCISWPRRRVRAVAAAAEAEDVADAAEDVADIVDIDIEAVGRVGKITKTVEAGKSAARLGLFEGRAVLVVLGALFGVAQNLVSFVHFLEFGLVAAGFVRMELVGFLAKGLLDILLARVFLDTKGFVVVFTHIKMQNFLCEDSNLLYNAKSYMRTYEHANLMIFACS